MPTYDYKCDHCGRASEKWFPMDQFKRERPCEDCSGTMRILVQNGIPFSFLNPNR